MQIPEKVVLAKNSIRIKVACFFYFITCGKYNGRGSIVDRDKRCKIYFGLLIHRIVCKNIYAIACLGILGCAIALPFVSQLQSFLHLNHFVKLIFENNLRAIAKLISVAFFSLLFTVFYSAQVIVSTKELNRAINSEKEIIEYRIGMGKERYNMDLYAAVNYVKYADLSKYTDYVCVVREYCEFKSKYKEILSSI
jgi:hypothetical protein